MTTIKSENKNIELDQVQDITPHNKHFMKLVKNADRFD